MKFPKTVDLQRNDAGIYEPQQEVLPHPFHDGQRTFLLSIARDTSKGKSDKPLIHVVGTDGSEDRHGSVINPRGWDMTAYRTNPVVLWGHDQRIPLIGNTVDLEFDKGRWIFGIEFAVEEWDAYGDRNLARLIWKLFDGDKMRATSVSFIPKEWQDRQATTIPSYFAENVEYTRQELTEISAVNIPSNRAALKKSIEDGTITENEADLLGLDRMFRLVPVLNIRTTDFSKPKPTDEKPVERSVVALHDGSADRFALKRCGGYYEQPKEVVSPEVQSYETELMQTLAAEALDSLSLAFEGWERASHDELRNVCRYRMENAIYTYDWLRALLNRFYAVDLTPVETSDTDSVEQGRSIVFGLGRAGAVLNKANRGKLAQVKTLVDEVLASAGATEEEEERTAPAVVDPEDAMLSIRNLFGTEAIGDRSDSQNQSATETGEGSAEPSTTRSYLKELFQ